MWHSYVSAKSKLSLTVFLLKEVWPQLLRMDGPEYLLSLNIFVITFTSVWERERERGIHWLLIVGSLESVTSSSSSSSSSFPLVFYYVSRRNYCWLIPCLLTISVIQLMCHSHFFHRVILPFEHKSSLGLFFSTIKRVVRLIVDAKSERKT